MEPPPAPTASKAEWRRWARTLPAVDAAATADVVGRLEEFLDGLDGPVLGYVALPDEVAIADLRLRAAHLPRLDDDGSMTIHRDHGRRERHRVGVEQPTDDALAVDPSKVAAVLVPGRVFDRDGYRLGRGGGHYDRLLTRLAPGVPVVGVTITARLVDRLPREPHDVPMSHLATEAGVFSAS